MMARLYILVTGPMTKTVQHSRIGHLGHWSPWSHTRRVTNDMTKILLLPLLPSLERGRGRGKSPGSSPVDRRGLFLNRLPRCRMWRTYE